MKEVNLTDFFKIKPGSYHAVKELEKGTIPLISCGDEDNGLVGYFDIPKEKRYSKTITVAFNGLPLTAKFHPYEFGAKDDVAVLIPKSPMAENTLVFITAMLNLQKWRYSYGRKCFQGKLEKLKLKLPLKPNNEIDEDGILTYLAKDLEDYIPTTSPTTFSVPSGRIQKKVFKIKHIFEVLNGQYHKTAGLDKGTIPLISCSENNNGIVGYYDIPMQNTHNNAITVSFDGLPLTVRYHGYAFAAYDNVGILKPRESLNKQTLIYIAGLITLQQWRYSYGRKCYMSKVNELAIELPVNSSGKIDEEFIANLLSSIPFNDVVFSQARTAVVI